MAIVNLLINWVVDSSLRLFFFVVVRKNGCRAPYLAAEATLFRYTCLARYCQMDSAATQILFDDDKQLSERSVRQFQSILRKQREQ